MGLTDRTAHHDRADAPATVGPGPGGIPGGADRPDLPSHASDRAEAVPSDGRSDRTSDGAEVVPSGAEPPVAARGRPTLLDLFAHPPDPASEPSDPDAPPVPS